MSRLLAYICNDDNLMPIALGMVRDAISLPDAGDMAGVGMGWVQDGRSLLRTTPKPSSTSGLLDLVSDIRARSMVAYVRESSEGAVGPLNLQPFRFRKWVFAHVGEEPMMAELRADLMSSVPGFLASNIKGTTAAEVFGHMFLGGLHAAHLLDHPATPQACGDVLAETVRQIQLRGAVAEFGAAVVSNHVLVAASVGRPMHYAVIRGLEVPREAPLFAGHKPKSHSHPSFRCVVVTDAPVDGAMWLPLRDESVLSVGREWDVVIRSVA